MLDKTDDRTNQKAQNKEHNREAEPAQSVSYGHRSDQQEVPSPEKSNPLEAADNINIRINQESAVEPAACAEIKLNAGPAQKGNDVANDVPTSIDGNPDVKDTVETGTSRGDDKDDAAGQTCKEVRTYKNSRFRVTLVNDTTTNEERGAEPTSKGDTKMTDDRSEVTFNDIVPEDSDKNPSASNSLN